MIDSAAIDLGHTDDFTIGRLLVRPSLRQLRRDDGSEEILEPRVMQVLVALARAGGAIVTRSDLSASCWENRVVGEDAINRVISRLRRIPDGIGQGSFRIETVTKIGYRLIAADEVAPGPLPAPPPVADSAVPGPEAAPVLPPPVPNASAAKRGFGRRWILGAVAATIMLVAAAALLTMRGVPPPRATRIAVLPFDVLSKDDVAKGFASALTDQILTGLNSGEMPAVSRADAMTLRGNDNAERLKALQVALVFDGSVQNDGKAITVQVHVNDPQAHAVIWSSSDQGTPDTLDALRTRVTRSVVGVLACSNRALKDNGLTDPALLGRYLHACDLFVNQSDARDPKATFDLLDSLRMVTQQAPNFVPAQTDLAKFEAYLAPLMPPAQAAAMRAESASVAAHALALDPKASDAYLAQEMRLPPTRWAEREALLRKGVAANPAWPHTNGFLAQLLAETGRMRESTVYAAHAAAADLQIDWRPASARLTCTAGVLDETIDDLKARLAAQPGDGSLRGALFGCLLYAKRFEEARGVFPMTLDAPGGRVTAIDVNNRLVIASLSRSPADRDATRTAALDLAARPQTPFGQPTAIMALSQLGYIDDAFAVAERYTPGYPMTGIVAFMFSPATDAMRRDPRFMRLAAKWGMVDFWRSTGKWPDYCADSTLPDTCKAEAQKVQPVKS